jgi:hypothetical protein
MWRKRFAHSFCRSLTGLVFSAVLISGCVAAGPATETTVTAQPQPATTTPGFPTLSATIRVPGPTQTPSAIRGEALSAGILEFPLDRSASEVGWQDSDTLRIRDLSSQAYTLWSLQQETLQFIREEDPLQVFTTIISPGEGANFSSGGKNQPVPDRRRQTRSPARRSRPRPGPVFSMHPRGGLVAGWHGIPDSPRRGISECEQRDNHLARIGIGTDLHR